MKKLEDFIANFSWKTFILTNKTAKYYHEIHGIMLYFIYLVYIISRNLMQAKEANAILQEGITSNWNVELMRKRLYYVHNINKETFVKYKERLELFFQLF